jgi:hypothetical protein
MFGLGPATKVYRALGATDMRKGFDGLYGLVRARLWCEPTSGHCDPGRIAFSARLLDSSIWP